MRRHSRTKKPMRFLVAVALTALITGPSVAADRDTERIVTRHVASIVPPDGAGGVAVALRIEGQSLFFNYGWADRANKLPITTDTLFNLASLRKVFEATLLAQAVRKSELRLDDPVAKYVVELQQGGDIRQVTLGQLATHTSGLLLPQDHPPLAGLGLHAAGVHPHAQHLESGQGSRSAASLYPCGLHLNAARARAPLRHADRRADRPASATAAGHGLDNAAAGR